MYDHQTDAVMNSKQLALTKQMNILDIYEKYCFNHTQLMKFLEIHENSETKWKAAIQEKYMKMYEVCEITSRTSKD